MSARSAGLLRETGSDQLMPLAVLTRVGRSSRSDILLSDPSVSAEHARLTWDASRWLLKDSAAATAPGWMVGKVAPGNWHPLRQGSRLTFAASPNVWVLHDAAPPAAFVQNLNDRSWRAEVDGVIDVDGLVLEVLSERAQLRRADTERPLTDGDEFYLGAEPWRARVPPAPTAPTAVQEEAVALVFEVSRDQEHIAISVELGPVTTSLTPRSFDYMLLLLAQARLSDRKAGVAPEREGWRVAADLARELGIDTDHLNVDVLRARNRFKDAGITDSLERTRSGLIRLGVENVRVR